MKIAGNRSSELFKKGQAYIPGGVNSPVRAFKAVGGIPPVIASARGARLTDVDGREYMDYLGSWGPMILGHTHPEVVTAIQEAAARGTSYGACTEGEFLLAERICRLWPSIESVRLVNSGTEATMSALRLARAFTGRDMIIKFDGCYHGHSDSLLVKAGSGVVTLGIPGTPGVPASFVEQTLSLPFNDLDVVETALKQHADKVAAIIVEPVPGNMGVVPPREGFLRGLLELGDRHGTVVIFDEVITGFRLALGGAQEKFGLKAPLTCLGKILGGGLPIGAYGGRRDIMEMVAPQGPVYQAGTLSGNPIAVAAGLKTLEILEKTQPYAELERKTGRLVKGLAEGAAQRGAHMRIQSIGSMFTPFFVSGPVTDFATASKADTQAFSSFFRGMLEAGVYLPPSQFETAFVSTAHTDGDIDHTISLAVNVLTGA